MQIEKTTIKVKKTHVFLVALIMILLITGSMIISAYKEYAASVPSPVEDEASISLIQLEEPSKDLPTALISTTMGDIKLVLYPEQAPKAVEIFTEAAKNGVYDGLLAGLYELGTIFTLDAPDTEDTYSIELSDDLWTFSGAVCMTEQKDIIFVNTVDFTDEEKEYLASEGELELVRRAYLEYGGIPNYARQYTVFGQVTEGMDVLKEIAKSPLETIIIINSVTIDFE